LHLQGAPYSDQEWGAGPRPQRAAFRRAAQRLSLPLLQANGFCRTLYLRRLRHCPPVRDTSPL